MGDLVLTWLTFTDDADDLTDELLAELVRGDLIEAGLL